MDNAVYTAIARQRGLSREIQAIANNIANASTTGFRRESVIFSEHVKKLDEAGTILSMASANGRQIHLDQGVNMPTGATFDFAIEGEGFFQVETPEGPALTRAGAFAPNAEGELVTPDGLRLLDEGGTPVIVPREAKDIRLAADGTLSADGEPLARIGLVRPADTEHLSRRGAMLILPGGEVEPVEEPKIFQGFLEQSNVNPIAEVARMIDVQRAYEAGQSFLDLEDARIRSVVDTLGA